jgi:genome maintenance exonuclease 1
MIIQKYAYPKLKRLQQKNGRKYTLGESKPVPSVTTILEKTGDKSHLIEWRKRVGEEEAVRISTEAAGFGTMTHNALEKYAKGDDWQITGNNFVHKMARAAAETMIEKGLRQVNELWGVEVGLIAKDIYAGTSDAVGQFNGVDSIIDFKTSKQIKKKEWITDYFLQGCAYALAHNEMFGSNIRQVVILMVDREANYADFIISGDEFDYYANLWGQRVLDYYNIK